MENGKHVVTGYRKDGSRVYYKFGSVNEAHSFASKIVKEGAMLVNVHPFEMNGDFKKNSDDFISPIEDVGFVVRDFKDGKEVNKREFHSYNGMRTYAVNSIGSGNSVLSEYETNLGKRGTVREYSNYEVPLNKPISWKKRL